MDTADILAFVGFIVAFIAWYEVGQLKKRVKVLESLSKDGPR